MGIICLIYCLCILGVMGNLNDVALDFFNVSLHLLMQMTSSLTSETSSFIFFFLIVFFSFSLIK